MFNFQQAMCGCTDHRTWLDIYKFAASRSKDWTYIIFGRGGPTGKTYLWDNMSQLGYKVIEITEDVGPIIDYKDRNNHYLIYEDSKTLIIILNKKLPEHIYPGRKNPNPAEFTPNDWLEVKQFDTRAEAEKHLDILKQMAEWYGCVTRADYMDLVGSKPRPVDHKYGWLEHEIKRARIVPGPFGWFIEFPRAVPLLD